MIRPATPLTVLLSLAFVLLLLSVLSVPIIKPVPLGSFQGLTFGVFGFCKPDGSCSGVEIGYNTGPLLSSVGSSTFDLPSSTRTTLSSILILHPIAALLTLIMLVLAITAHFHSPSHSVRYLLLVFIISIFTFLATLLAFLIDVLLFVPHISWGSYIVLAAACLVGLSSIVACAMRRTLVSRKSRQRRIAANAEMSGENFYNRQAQESAAVTASAALAPATTAVANSASPASSATRQPTLPHIGGPSSTGDSFEKRDDGSSDEQIPLTSQASQMPGRYSQQDLRLNSQSGPPIMTGAAGGMPSQRYNRPSSGQRDPYGNPISYGNGMSSPPQDGGYGVRRGPSFERMNNMPYSQRGGRGGGGPGYRGGRGGAPMPGPPGPYGPQGGRGGYMGPAGGRGGYGPPPNRGRGGRGGYPGPGRGRTPPPGYRYEQQGSYGNGGMHGPSPSPGPYYRNTADSAPNLSGAIGGNGGYDTYRNDRGVSELPRAESPPPLPGMGSIVTSGVASGVTGGVPNEGPIGQAIEMDATTPRAQAPQPNRFNDADSDIAGMVGLQQGRTSNTIPEHEETSGQYVPPRAAWNTQGGHNTSPVSSRRRTPSEAYIEDTDPRFAERRDSPPAFTMPTSTSYEDIPQGSRSPAESERSTFTSISQRGINPRWNPPPPALMPGYGGGGGPTGPPGSGSMHDIPRRPVRDPNEALLSSNPDFSLPTGNRRPPGGLGGPSGNMGSISGTGAGSASGLIPGSAYPPL